MNATDLQYKDEQFDRVTAIECCAFYFHYRVDFLKEGVRVLKPGGQLVLTDWIKGRSTDNKFNKQLGHTALKFWGIPKENIIDTQAYSEILKELGFKNICITSISDRAIPHYIDYIRSKKCQKELMKTTGRTQTWTYTMMLQAVMFLYRRGLVDYVLVKAEK
jgi:ubiquinone/menaquinone biosynthesis C-methylase UbiE